MTITGKTIPIGVIGDPVAHSISPQIHNTLAETMGLGYAYGAYPVKQAALTDAIRGMAALGFAGVNVTIPHKEGAFHLCDEVDDYAARCGAVNTVVVRDGRLCGYNTDAPGFVKNLARHGVIVTGRHVCILGAGGAARGIAVGLAEAGAESIAIVNRTRARAEALAAELGTAYPGVFSAADSVCGAELLVNATSVGMKSDATPLPASELRTLAPEAVVCDAVYCPRETTLLKDARAAGLRTIGGIGMLIYQAVLAFMHFTGAQVSQAAIDRLFRMLDFEGSIFLSGFMGCGKSSCGRALAELLGAEFIDSDALIEAREGMTISAIFAQKGEPYFRDKEAAILRELSQRRGAVVAMGGGAVLRSDTIDDLREQGRVFRLYADVETILRNVGSAATRPLLHGKSPFEVATLLEEREPFYRNCDATLDVSHLSVDDAAAALLRLCLLHEK